MDYQEAINKANQQISEKMKREIFERLSISPIDAMHKCDGRVSAHEAIVSAVDEARRCRMYEKMEEVSGLKKFYEEVYPQVMENLKMLVEYQKLGTLEEVREAVEKQRAISREIIEGKYFCPKCHNLMPYPGYCGCGQKLY